MTAKEKAKELVDKFRNIEIEYSCPVDLGDGDFDDSYSSKNLETNEAKQCALIAVDEFIAYLTDWKEKSYWKEVKQEIENGK